MMQDEARLVKETVTVVIDSPAAASGIDAPMLRAVFSSGTSCRISAVEHVTQSRLLLL